MHYLVGKPLKDIAPKTSLTNGLEVPSCHRSYTLSIILAWWGRVFVAARLLNSVGEKEVLIGISHLCLKSYIFL